MTAITGPKVTLKRAGGTDRPRLYEWLIGSDLTANMMGGQMFPDHPLTPPDRFAAHYPDCFYDGSRPYAGRMFLISARGELASALHSQAVSWSIHEPGNPSLADGRARSSRAVMGGIDVDTLAHGAPEAVLEQGRAAVSSTGGAGVVLAPGCSVPPEAPEENLQAVVQSSVAPQR